MSLARVASRVKKVGRLHADSVYLNLYRCDCEIASWHHSEVLCCEHGAYQEQLQASKCEQSHWHENLSHRSEDYKIIITLSDFRRHLRYLQSLDCVYGT